MNFYQKSKAEIIEQFKVDLETGLTAKQVIEQRTKFGENKSPEKREDPYWKILLKSFKEPIIIVLIGAVILSLLSAYYKIKVQGQIRSGQESLYEAAAIFILIMVNAILGFWQEISARKSLNALKEMNNRYTNVLRDGKWQSIPAHELVVGDVISSQVGDFVEADVRWLEVSELQVIESHLTGEADAIEKQTEAIEDEVEVADRNNMGFSGSTVTNGHGLGVVVAVGSETELGNIAQMIEEVEDKPSPLQDTVKDLTKVMMIMAAILVVFTFIMIMIKTKTMNVAAFATVLSTALALAVASVPDALPAVLSIVLTIGARKMAKNNGLIKSLNSAETLGVTSYICSDKTGTLTKNEMTVVQYYANGQYYQVDGLGYKPEGEIHSQNTDEHSDQAFLKGAVLCNTSTIETNEQGEHVPVGAPTEVALTVLGKKAHIDRADLLKDNEIVRTLPFSSSRKMMSVVVKEQDRYIVYAKGAPDVMVKQAHAVLLNDQVDDSEAAKTNFLATVNEFADEALRTLAVGQKEVTEQEALNAPVEELEAGLVITGVAGIIDPPREEVKASIKNLHDAKIEVVMITGDHENTARAIAADLGIISSKNAPVITGAQLEKMTDEELFERVPVTNVYARVSPAHKQRIIKQLQKHNQVTAMTGDGVNDAPALRAADIGIAMGITGTEVTKDSADLILLDDNFTTIESAVKSGRTIYGNIKNFIRHELTTNVAEVLAILLGFLFFNHSIGQVAVGTPTLTALMVLWVNMISDSLPSFSLGYDVPEAGIMQKSPRDPKESVLANHVWSRVLIRGFFMGVLVFAAFLWAARQGMSGEEAQTIAFLTLVYGQLWHIFDARSTKTLFDRNPFENKRLIAAVLFAGISSFLVTVIPFFQFIMGTTALNWQLYLLVIFVPALPTFILSGLKKLFKIKIW
ncbi:cation-transporting P-type ATPase [Lactobacillus sp. ESL0681]|uniref:cation-translocating P-type ATPase n=1 Tax=Lactobacillus sp. ESL0681 TaxID=2983211 RepID=UPI0023F7029F|nr:cation-transporting P-type ATPase [Lactobacillus sp. ESL0681]WEV39922.1 cation-transporting P-type ATPase [Lactobacillus sp. ESL0681]